MTFQKELYTYSAPASIYSKHLGPAFRVGFKGMQKSLGIREIPWGFEQKLYICNMQLKSHLSLKNDIIRIINSEQNIQTSPQGSESGQHHWGKYTTFQ